MRGCKILLFFALPHLKFREILSFANFDSVWLWLLYIGVIPRFGHNFSNVYRANIEDQELLVNNDSLNELDRIIEDIEIIFTSVATHNVQILLCETSSIMNRRCVNL